MSTFYGPIHFDEVAKNGNINPKTKGINIPINLNLNSPGIYIWGFIYSIDDKGNLLDIIDCEKGVEFNPLKMKFIPYYVGQASNSIFTRIKKHHNVKSNDANKYIRISKSSMKTFFTNLDFPIKYSRNKNNQQAITFSKKNPGFIEYFNDGEFLNNLYPNMEIPKREKQNQQWPITNFNFIPDTLDDFVNNKKNFWFCFMPIENINLLRDFEVETFYGLKGITVSDTNKYHKVKKITKLKDGTLCDIFKHKTNSTDIDINDEFLGY